MNVTDVQGVVGVLASGGLDSCILISHLLRQGRRIQPLYIRSQLVWERAELKALSNYLNAVRSPKLRDLVTLDLPLADLYGSHWSMTGRGTPTSDAPDQDVFLPGRNALLLVKAAVWCQMHGVCELTLAPLADNPFADSTPHFFRCAEALFNCYEGASIRIVLPFANFDKRQVMEHGRNDPLELTFSCISPVGDVHCGSCNKCAERQRAFCLIGLRDPTHYANDRRI